MKAPGGSINKINVLAFSEINFKPNKLPLPKISRTTPKTVRAITNPIPIPKASIIEENKLFFEANASALPNIKQFTTINGIKIPSCSNKNGIKASNTISTMVTKDAIIIINAGIRTLLGICDLTRETTIFDINKTNNVATPIPKPLYADDVTPNVGHIPNNITKTGFSLIIPLNKFCF